MIAVCEGVALGKVTVKVVRAVPRIPDAIGAANDVGTTSTVDAVRVVSALECIIFLSDI